MNPNYELLPARLRAGMRRYIEDRIETGSFLRAVLDNNFTEAVLRAADESRAALLDIALFLTSEIPDEAWGSPAKVEAWLARGAQ